MRLERSIDIVLSDRLPEPESAQAVLVPLNPTESLIASRGLGKHIDVLYGSIRRNSNHQRALEGVYELISDDIEDYRERSMNLAGSLDSLRAIKVSRAPAALALSYLMVGQESHRSGSWVSDKNREALLKRRFREVMASDDLTFFEQMEWAIRQIVLNDRHWRQQLQATRSHPRIIELREAIEAADHQPTL